MDVAFFIIPQYFTLDNPAYRVDNYIKEKSMTKHETDKQEKAFKKAMHCLQNGSEKEAYEILKGMTDRLKAMIEDEEFITVFEKDDPDFESRPISNAEISFRLENVEKVVCDLFEKVENVKQ